MKFLGRLFLFLLFAGNLTYMGALSLHVVRSPGGTDIVPKGQTTLLETFVDTRTWTASDLREHASVVNDINRAGKGNLIAQVGGSAPTMTPQQVVPQKPTEKTAAPETADKSIFDFTK